MAYSLIPKMRKDGVILLTDGAANTLTVSYEDGNFTFTPVKSGTPVILRDRGTITNVRNADFEPSASGSFSIHLRQFRDGGEAGSVMDFVNKTGHYSGNTSTGDTGVPLVEEYCITIRYTCDSSISGDVADTYVDLQKCVCNVSFAESDPSTLTIDFVSYGSTGYSG